MTSMTTPEASSQRNVKVVIVCGGSNDQSLLTFKLQDLWEREHEMQAAAEQFCIDPASWSGSRLHKMYTVQDSTEFVLYPEEGCATQNYSHCLKWSPWLTELMQNYYLTGKLSIPTNSRGYEILLALEYFGILYQPQQLEFASYSTYSRVKLWSDYFTHRSVMGDWIANKVVEQGSGRLVFGTTPSQKETLEMEDEKVVPFVPVESEVEIGSNTSVLGAEVVFDFFNAIVVDGDQATVDRSESAAMMRHDFADYVQHIVTDIRVRFMLQTVRVDQESFQERAVLRVDVIDPNESSGQPSPSMDDMLNRIESSASQSSPRRLDDTEVQKLYRERSPARRTDSREDPPAEIGTMRAESFRAPVNVIRTPTTENSVASALTLPHALKRDGEEESREWLSKESLNKLNHFGTIIKQASAQVTEQVENATRKIEPEKIPVLKESIDWFSGLGLCEYPRAVVREINENGCTAANFEMPPPPSPSTNRQAAAVVTPEGSPNTPYDEAVKLIRALTPENNSSRMLTQPGSAFNSANNNGVTVRDRLAKQECPEERRSLSESEDRSGNRRSPPLIAKELKTDDRTVSIGSDSSGRSDDLLTPAVARNIKPKKSSLKSSTKAAKPNNKKKGGGLRGFFRRRASRAEV